MEKMIPCLWFNNNAEQAIDFYRTVFDNVEITDVLRNGADAGDAEGTILTAEFKLDGHTFVALNGGPAFPFTEAISIVIYCDTQSEIDDKWAKLTADGGKEVECGWLKDKFGLSWQIVPPQLIRMMQDKDTVKATRVKNAMLKMVKLDIAALEKAFNGV